MVKPHSSNELLSQAEHTGISDPVLPLWNRAFHKSLDHTEIVLMAPDCASNLCVGCFNFSYFNFFWRSFTKYCGFWIIFFSIVVCHRESCVKNKGFKSNISISHFSDHSFVLGNWIYKITAESLI